MEHPTNSYVNILSHFELQNQIIMREAMQGYFFQYKNEFYFYFSPQLCEELVIFLVSKK